MLDFTTAWSTYLRYQRWLPAPPPPTAPQRVDDLMSLLGGPLAGAIDALIFDAYGVLNRGDQPIDGARHAFQAVRALGLPLVVLTNDASGDRNAIAAKHRRRGFDVCAAEVVAGVELLDEVLGGLPQRTAFGYLGPQRRPCSRVTADLADISSEDTDLDALQGMVLLESDAWDDRLQDRLRATLARRARPLYIGNPDVTAPVGDRLSVEPGYHVVNLAEHTDIQPILLGKPGLALYRRALQVLGSPPAQRVLAIGDSPHTDVLGARRAGMRSLLVESGLLRGQDTGARLAECGILPDFLAPHI